MVKEKEKLNIQKVLNLPSFHFYLYKQLEIETAIQLVKLSNMSSSDTQNNMFLILISRKPTSRSSVLPIVIFYLISSILVSS